MKKRRSTHRHGPLAPSGATGWEEAIRLGLGGTLVLAVLVAYLPAAGGQFLWDDQSYIPELTALRTVEGVGAIWTDTEATPQYYPMVFSSFWLEFRLWGLDPTGYHVVNILLHAAIVLLLWAVLSRLRVAGAWLVAALFAVHPANVESVAWIAERKNVLSGLFALLALLAYMRFWPIAPPDEDAVRRVHAEPPRRWGFYALAVLCFVLALLSKTIACSLPAVILVLLWWKRRLTIRRALPLVPMLLIGAAMGLFTAWVESTKYGQTPGFGALALGERILVAGRALWFYAATVLWPFDVMAVYPQWRVSTAVWWQHLFPIAAATVIALLWLGRRRIGRGPLAAVLIFAGTLFPALGFFTVAYQIRYSYVADHFLYLSAVPLLALVAAGAVRLPALLGRRGVAAGLAAATGVVLAAFGVKTWLLCGNYRDPMVLWQATVRQNPDSAIVRCNLGEQLRRAGRTEQAIEQFRRSIELDPLLDLSWVNLGYIHSRRGDFEQSIHCFTQAIQANPRQTAAYINRGEDYRVRGQRGDLERALADCDEAVRLSPHMAAAWGNRGLLLSTMGRHAEALNDFDRSLALDPTQPTVYDNRGAAHGALRQYDRALRDFDRAITLDPKLANAYRNRAAVLNRLGRPQQAQADLKTCLTLGGQVEPALADAIRRASADF